MQAVNISMCISWQSLTLFYHFTVVKILIRISQNFRQTTVNIWLRADPGCHHLYSVLSPVYQRCSHLRPTCRYLVSSATTPGSPAIGETPHKHSNPRQLHALSSLAPATVVVKRDTDRQVLLGRRLTQTVCVQPIASQRTKILGYAGLSNKRVRTQNAIFPVSSLNALSTGVAFPLPVSTHY